MHQPCKTCPFRENPAQVGGLDWLCDVMQRFLIKEPFDHSCHLTDKHADLYAGRKRSRPCVGFLGMLKRFDGGKLIGRRAMSAIARGEIDWGKIPTKGVFASPRDAVQFHLEANGLQVPEAM